MTEMTIQILLLGGPGLQKKGKLAKEKDTVWKRRGK